jgi:hypothetical protein
VILGFGSVAGLLLGALAGIVSIVEQAGQEGAQVDLKPLVVKLLGTSGVALIVLRGMKSAGEQVGKAWDRMLASANAATQVINATLDSAEQQFYSSLGARRPSRVSLKIAGPGAAILLMLGIALVAAIPVYFVFVSFTTPHSPSARPF